MHVRLVLSDAVGAIGHAVEQRVGRDRCAVGMQREYGYASTAVIGRQDHVPVRGYMTGVGAESRMAVKQTQLSSGRVERQQVEHGTAVVHLADGIDVFQVGRYGQERRIGQGDGVQQAAFSRVPVETEGVDTVAVPVGVSAHQQGQFVSAATRRAESACPHAACKQKKWQCSHLYKLNVRADKGT